MERNTVVRVVDGDSLETKDRRRIRLLGIDAPDRNRCLYSEAKEELARLVLGRRVRLTDVVTDDYGRILANVWVRNESGNLLSATLRRRISPLLLIGFDFLSFGQSILSFLNRTSFLVSRTPKLSLSGLLHQELLVNKLLVGEGLAKFVYVSSPYYEELKETAKIAKEKKIGIYSDLCRETTPKDECLIKGNINTEGEKLYHLPYCLHYKEVIIDRAFGDRWFCTEEEATRAGFRKAGGC